MDADSESQNASAQFLKRDGGKTQPNEFEIPSISLPNGGGAIKWIDEKISVNAVNCITSFSIPLPFSSACGASPAISLTYNSDAGNGLSDIIRIRFGRSFGLTMETDKHA